MFIISPPAAAHPHTALHCSAAARTSLVLPARVLASFNPATADNARPAVLLPVLHPAAGQFSCVACTS